MTLPPARYLTAVLIAALALVAPACNGSGDEGAGSGAPTGQAAAAPAASSVTAGAPSGAGVGVPGSNGLPVTAPGTEAATSTSGTDGAPASSAADPTVPGSPATLAPGAGGTQRAPAVVPGSRWRPGASSPLTLHWVLGGVVDVNDPVAMGLRDLAGNPLPEPDVYDIDGQMNSEATVKALHARGKRVICYFDAGVYESYRPDAGLFPKSVIGSPDEGWDNSWWLDIRQIAVLEPIMRGRIEACRAKGFDAVEPDEIDGYSNDSGFPLTAADQLAYNRAVASWAHEAGLSVGLKGDIDQAADLVSSFDWTLNEECFRYDECQLLNAFVKADKAVWIAEYRAADLTAQDCAAAVRNRWNAARYLLGLPLDGGRQPCGGW